MDLTRLRIGELVALVASCGLLVVLFLRWSGGASGFGSLGWLMVLLLLLTVGLGLSVALSEALTAQPAAVATGAAALAFGLGAVIFVVLVVRIVFLADPQVWAFAGLLLAALVPAGGYLVLDDERTDAAAGRTPALPPRPLPPVG